MTEEPGRKKYDRVYRERHRVEIAAKDRERKRLEREKAKAWDLEHGGSQETHRKFIGSGDKS